jgi:exopolysaccharide biosynthesis protein
VQPITYNREELKKASGNMVHPRDGTNTTAGIETAIQLFQKNGRKNVPWTCIVITDGLSKNPPATAEMAAAAKAAGKKSLFYDDDYNDDDDEGDTNECDNSVYVHNNNDDNENKYVTGKNGKLVNIHQRCDNKPGIIQ